MNEADIVTRLKRMSYAPHFSSVGAANIMIEAAKEIELLRDKIHGLEQHLVTAHNEALGNLNRL